jgi:hypothetical protein
MDPDMNKYDLEHVVAAHPRMSPKEWRDVYEEAWASYYTPDHLQTILRRGVTAGMGVSRLQAELFFYSTSYPVEKVHPEQCGVFRMKRRQDRRPGLPVEPVWMFYPKYWWEVVSKHVRILRRWLMIEWMLRRAKRDQKRAAYTDLAMTPVTDDETDKLEMFTHNEAARNAVAHVRKVEALTHGAVAPVAQPPIAAQTSS